MSDTAIFVLIFGGLFVLRIVAATFFFYCIMPISDRCPCCDAPTIRVERTGWDRIVPLLRNSWCLSCGWAGFLRSGALTPASTPAARQAERV